MARSQYRLLAGVVGLLGVSFGLSAHAVYIGPSSGKAFETMVSPQKPSPVVSVHGQKPSAACSVNLAVAGAARKSHQWQNTIWHQSANGKREVVVRNDGDKAFHKPHKLKPSQSICSPTPGVSEIISEPESTAGGPVSVDGPITEVVISLPEPVVDVPVIEETQIGPGMLEPPVVVVVGESAAVPLPGALLLFASGLLGLSLFRRRQAH